MKKNKFFYGFMGVMLSAVLCFSITPLFVNASCVYRYDSENTYYFIDMKIYNLDEGDCHYVLNKNSICFTENFMANYNGYSFPVYENENNYVVIDHFFVSPYGLTFSDGSTIPLTSHIQNYYYIFDFSSVDETFIYNFNGSKKYYMTTDIAGVEMRFIIPNDVSDYLQSGSFTSGYNAGYESGYAKGKKAGESSGYESGYSSGKTDGESSGYESGYSSGKTDGESSGYESGYADGLEVGDPDNVYKAGYSAGETDGYNKACKEGYNENFNFSDLIFEILDAPFTLINNCLNFEIFGVDISQLVKFLLTISIVAFVIGRFAK